MCVPLITSIGPLNDSLMWNHQLSNIALTKKWRVSISQMWFHRNRRLCCRHGTFHCPSTSDTRLPAQSSKHIQMLRTKLKTYWHKPFIFLHLLILFCFLLVLSSNEKKAQSRRPFQSPFLDFGLKLICLTLRLHGDSLKTWLELPLLCVSMVDLSFSTTLTAAGHKSSGSAVWLMGSFH